MGWAARWGGVERGGVGGMGGGKNYRLGHPMSSHDVHTVANDTIVQWEQTQVPTAQLAPSMGTIVPAVTLKGWQKALYPSRPVNI